MFSFNLSGHYPYFYIVDRIFIEAYNIFISGELVNQGKINKDNSLA